MAIPAYLWLKDDGGADIRGPVDVAGRLEATYEEWKADNARKVK